MKRAIAVGLTALFALACADRTGPVEPQFSVTGATSHTVVVGQGDPLVDVPAVQHAVDNYAKVKLEGTFDFGDGGYVLITKPVELAGTMEESDVRGQEPRWSTTILGGGSGCDAACMGAITIVNGTDGKVTIKDIAFDGATEAAILYLKGQDLEVSRVKVTNVSPAINHFGFPFRSPISAFDDPRDNSVDISGSIHIHDSYVDVAGTYTHSRAIFIGWGMADVTIADNYLSEPFPYGAAIEVFLGSRTVKITGNQTAAGYYCAAVLDNQGPIHITNNTCESARWGIIATSLSEDGGTVADNDIHLSGGRVAIQLGWEGHLLSGYQPVPWRNGAVRRNRITGTVHQDSPGIIAVSWYSSNNTLEKNKIDVMGLDDGTPGFAYYFTDTSHDNVAYLRKGDTYLDEGTNNQIIVPGGGN
jgi:hypothetical protein